jgi:hypothetical protein
LLKNSKGENKMTENLQDTLKSLLTKLSAVRVTLTDPEQSLLDQLILGSKEEVAAQALKMTKPVQTSPDEVAAQALKMTKPVATSPDEVAAQALKMTKPVATSPDEVAAQALKMTKPVQTSPDEVAAQALKMTKPVQTSPDEAAAQALKMTKPVATSPDEVKANRLLFLEEAKQSDTDEVSAHSMPATMLPKLGIQNPVWVRIIYDPRMECYQVI